MPTPDLAGPHLSAVLAAMPPGIGDLSFASPDWVDAARAALEDASTHHAEALADLGTFTLCEVACNPPAYLRAGDRLAWHARFDGASVTVGTGELEEQACGFKLAGDHSVMSNLGRLKFSGTDPVILAAARARLMSLSRWETHGGLPAHPALAAVLAELHDAMAPRTMPRFVFMTPEWVSSARHVLTTRAESEKYAPGLKDVVYTFAEEFTDTPAYAFPDGRHGGFWARCDHGRMTVGAGPLPEAYAPADMLTLGAYTPVVPVGRTVEAAFDEDDREEAAAYRKTAFAKDLQTGEYPVVQSTPTGREMPAALARVFVPLHDELSKRTSGELPADFLDVAERWATPQGFDRAPGYDSSWLRYDRVDIYGEPRS